jgi:hypothetical protein
MYQKTGKSDYYRKPSHVLVSNQKNPVLFLTCKRCNSRFYIADRLKGGDKPWFVRSRAALGGKLHEWMNLHDRCWEDEDIPQLTLEFPLGKKVKTVRFGEPEEQGDRGAEVD